MARRVLWPEDGTREGTAVGEDDGSDELHPGEEYLRASQAAAILHVSPQTVSRWADEGKIQYAVTVGGHRRFPRTEIERVGRQRPT